MKDSRLYWNYVLRTTSKEIEAYKKLYGDRYEGTPEAKLLADRMNEALENLK